MEHEYETRDGSTALKLMLIFTGILLIAMGIFFPEDKELPQWGNWLLRAVLIFFGILDFAVVPEIRLRAYPDHLQIRYGLTNLVRFNLSADKIISIEAVKYNPLLEFGGWGIKGGRGQYKGFTAFTASMTNRALAIRTTEKNYLIGCKDPEEAETMIKNIIGIS